MFKRLLRRLSRFMLAETHAEIAALRQEMARRDELAALTKQMDAALLAIALGKKEG